MLRVRGMKNERTGANYSGLYGRTFKDFIYIVREYSAVLRCVVARCFIQQNLTIFIHQKHNSR